jgi:hypothetical protein
MALQRISTRNSKFGSMLVQRWRVETAERKR